MSEIRLIENYLNQYAEAESLIEWPFQRHWEYVLCVPVCDESPTCIEDLIQDCDGSNVLIVVVVNHPEGHVRASDWQERNCLMRNHMCSAAGASAEISDTIRFLTYQSGLSCMLIDRSSQNPIPAQKGVGLARKIAADVALKLISTGTVKQPWIFSTDADVRLPHNYFSSVDDQEAENISALCLPFEHVIKDQPWSLQQQLYDFKLYYYQAGIRLTQAKYDYIPLGSTLIVAATAYAQVRGFPPRNGAEDFYILNKLAKLGNIFQPVQPTIKIQSRLSERVPFGTGPAVQSLLQQPDAKKLDQYYHPHCFIQLKQWVQFLQSFWTHKEAPTADQPILCDLFTYFGMRQVLEKSLPHIRTEARWFQFVHEWLDAFRLLKSVHFLSERFPRVNLEVLLKEPEFDVIDVDGTLRRQAQNIL